MSRHRAPQGGTSISMPIIADAWQSSLCDLPNRVTLALTWPTKRGITVSTETMRRWLQELDWVWKRSKVVARDDDLQWVDRLARIRWVFEPLTCGEAMRFADELDLHLWPTVG